MLFLVIILIAFIVLLGLILISEQNRIKELLKENNFKKAENKSLANSMLEEIKININLKDEIENLKTKIDELKKQIKSDTGLLNGLDILIKYQDNKIYEKGCIIKFQDRSVKHFKRGIRKVKRMLFDKSYKNRFKNIRNNK